MGVQIPSWQGAIFVIIIVIDLSPMVFFYGFTVEKIAS